MYDNLAAIYDRFMLEDVDYKRYASWIQNNLNKNGIEKGEILEVGCGTGSMTLALYQLGHKMTGLDLSGEMLTEADSKAFETGANIRWIQGDIVEMTFPAKFDAVVSTMDTFNYILEEEELIQAMEHVWDALKPGGIFLFDVNTPYRLQEVYGNNTFHYVGEDVSYIWECTYDESNEYSRFDITFFVQEEEEVYHRFDECHIQRAYSQETLKRALEKAGFVDVAVFDYLSEGPGEDTSEKVHIAAKKSV